MTRTRGWRLDALILVGYLLALVALFWPVILGGKVLIPFDNLYTDPPWREFAGQLGVSRPQNGLLGDLVYQNLAWKRFILDSLRARQVPLWNPYLFAGVPFLAAGQHSALYPLSLIYYLMPLAQAYGVFTVMQLWLAGALAYAYARIIWLSRFAAAVVGFTWMLSTLMIANVVFPMILAAISWLPAILAAIELVIRDAGWEQGRQRLSGSTKPNGGWLPSGRVVWWLIGGTAVVGLELLAGHPEISLYVLMVSAAYGLWRLAGQWHATGDGQSALRVLTWLAVMGGLGVMLAGVQLVPQIELARSSYRQGSASFQQVLGWALPIRQLATFLIPDFFGNPSHHQVFDLLRRSWTTVPGGSTAWGIKNYVEAASYVGVLPLVLATAGTLAWRAGVRDRRTKAGGQRVPAEQSSDARLPVAPTLPPAHTAFFILLAGVSLLFAFGTPAYALLYWLPGFNQLHTPFRWVFPYCFAVAVLAGIGGDALLRLEPARPGGKLRRAVAGNRLLAAALLVAGIGTLAVVALAAISPTPALSVTERLLRSSEAARAAFGSAPLMLSYEMANLALFGVFVAVSGLVLYLGNRFGTAANASEPAGEQPTPGGRWRRVIWPVLVVALVVADLLVHGYGFNPAVDSRLADVTPPSVAWLQRNASQARITSFGPENTLWPNTAMLFGIQDMRGYDSIIPRQYVETVNQVEDQSGMLLYNRIKPLDQADSLDAPLVDLLGVKYVLATQRLDEPGYRLVYDGEILIYENEGALPRAFTVPEAKRLPREQVLESLADFDPARVVLLEETANLPSPPPSAQGKGVPGNVSITRYTPNHVELDVSGAAGWLVLADSYFPGWKAYATVDGQPGEEELTIERADGNFRAVELPPGATSVRFTYSPMSFKLGLYLSFMAVICVMLAAGYWLWGRLYRVESLDASARDGEVVHRVARNSLAPMTTSLVNKVIDFAFAALMLRILGPTLAGRYYFAIVVVGYLDIFSNFGLNLLLIREVARDHTQANRYLGNTVALRLILWLVSLPVLALFLVVWGGWGDLTVDTALAIILLMLSLIPSNLAAALSSVFNAFERMEYPAGITTLTTLVKVGLGVLVLLLGWGFVGLAGVSIVANLVTVAILARLVVQHYFRPRLQFDARFVWGLVFVSYPLMLNHLLQSFFFKADVMLLQPIKGDTVVGWYSTAYKWIDALLIIPAYFTMAIFPLMSRYAASAQDSLRRAYILALRFLVIIALPVAVLTTFIADVLILILGGQAYLPESAIALRIMIWFLPFSFVNGVTQYALIALNEQRWITKTFAVAAVFNIAANLLLIPRFSYVGAAAVTIVSEWVLLVPWVWLTRQHLGRLPWPVIVVRPALAAAGMAVALWLLQPVSLVISIPAAGLVYCALLAALGTFSAEDRALVRRLLPSRSLELAETRGNS